MTEPDDRELDRRIANLPRSVPPSRDLWGDIASRIASSRPANARRKNVSIAVAAVLAVAAALALVVGGRLHRAGSSARSSPHPATVGARGGVVFSPAAPAPAFEKTKEREAYRTAAAALEASFAENRRYLSADAAKRLDASLVVLDQAILATEEALARDPESAELYAQLWDVYQQKIDALAAVVDLVARMS